MILEYNRSDSSMQHFRKHIFIFFDKSQPYPSFQDAILHLFFRYMHGYVTKEV